MFVFQAHVYQERRIMGKAFELDNMLVFCARASFSIWARRKESPSPNVCVRTNESATSSKRLWRYKLIRNFFRSFYTHRRSAAGSLERKRLSCSRAPSQPKLALVVLEEECVLLNVSSLFSSFFLYFFFFFLSLSSFNNPLY